MASNNTLNISIVSLAPSSASQALLDLFFCTEVIILKQHTKKKSLMKTCVIISISLIAIESMVRFYSPYSQRPQGYAAGKTPSDMKEVAKLIRHFSVHPDLFESSWTLW